MHFYFNFKILWNAVFFFSLQKLSQLIQKWKLWVIQFTAVIGPSLEDVRMSKRNFLRMSLWLPVVVSWWKLVMGGSCSAGTPSMIQIWLIWTFAVNIWVSFFFLIFSLVSPSLNRIDISKYSSGLRYLIQCTCWFLVCIKNWKVCHNLNFEEFSQFFKVFKFTACTKYHSRI